MARLEQGLSSGKPFSHRTVCAVAALAWWLVSLWLLLKPASLPGAIPHFDKFGHAAMFAVQATLLFGAAGGRASRVWLALLPWAVGSELLQGWLTLDRSPEALDAIADMTGAMLVLWPLSLIAKARLNAPAASRSTQHEISRGDACSTPHEDSN
ncbi:hypothetical protein [Crenobacter cavernae]|uniref:hypothetical protein n=1 Tax=Crenobacter cavernae TaxID=2290923 RepID=UPI00196ADD22|nr:hypothetical protein [Crenobacter cavernae]